MDTTFLAHKQHIKGCQIPWIKLKGVLPNKNHSFKPFTATPIAHCTPTCDQHITCIYPPMISLLTHHHVIPAKSRTHIQQSPHWDIHPWTLTPPTPHPPPHYVNLLITNTYTTNNLIHTSHEIMHLPVTPFTLHVMCIPTSHHAHHQFHTQTHTPITTLTHTPISHHAHTCIHHFHAHTH